MKKQLLLLVMILLPMVASADAVEIDGIYYNLVSKTKNAEVTKNPNKYTGTVVIPESVTYENVNYSVTSIGEHAFQQCFALTSATIPNSVTDIGSYAFLGCSSLSSVILSKSLSCIEKCVFGNCSSLTSVSIPNSVTNIKFEAFYGCSSLTSLIMPNSLTSIGESALSGCTSLSSVTIPNSVTGIGEKAFESCQGLTSVTIGSGIRWIGARAFASCPNLTNVYSHAVNVPNTDINAFKDSYIDYATLHVPAESVNSYKVADPWKSFKSIVSIEGGETPEPQKCEKPTISYNNGQLKFASATDGVEFVSEITDSDIKKNYEATVTLTATYNISVYATKTGYENSETATATLCWIDKEPTTEGITDGVAQIPSKAVLIQSEGGILKVEGIDDGTQVAVYTPDGKQAGSAICRNGAALVGTSIQPGNTAIVKIGEKSVKVIVK